MSCTSSVGPAQDHLVATSTTVQYRWFGDWELAIGVTALKAVIKRRQTTAFQTQLAIQVAAVRPDMPSAPQLLGSVASGDGEDCSGNVDISSYGDVNVRAFDAAPRGPLPQALPADALITYKFGHWCGSDRFVVATVFAQAKDPEPVLQSRVLLFDTRSPQEMWDLTDLVEALKGVPRGTWRAMFSACIEAS